MYQYSVDLAQIKRKCFGSYSGALYQYAHIQSVLMSCMSHSVCIEAEHSTTVIRAERLCTSCRFGWRSHHETEASVRACRSRCCGPADAVYRAATTRSSYETSRYERLDTLCGIHYTKSTARLGNRHSRRNRCDGTNGRVRCRGRPVRSALASPRASLRGYVRSSRGCRSPLVLPYVH